MRLLKIALFLLSPLVVFSQSKDIEIIEEEVDDNTLLKAQNNTDGTIKLTLELKSKGLGIRKNKTFKLDVAPKKTEEIVLLKPKPGKAYSYSYSVKYSISRTVQIEQEEPVVSSNVGAAATPIEEEIAVSETTNNTIIVYSKTGCARCTRTIKYLKANNIDYLEQSITKNQKNRRAMNVHLSESGFPGGSLTTPVIVVNGKANYSIKKLDSFLSKLK